MGDFATMAMMGLNMVQKSKQAKAQQGAAMAQQRADIQQRQYQLQIQEREKRARMDRALATQRSRFGSQGLNQAGGSAAALLQGMRKETEQSISDDYGLESMRVNQRAESNKRRSRINLLETRNSQVNQGLGSMFSLLK